MATNTQTFNISFPRELVRQIDKVAKRQFGSRSDFLRTAALEYIRKEQLWGYIFDEGKNIGQGGQRLTDDEVATLVSKSRRSRRTVAR